MDIGTARGHAQLVRAPVPEADGLDPAVPSALAGVDELCAATEEILRGRIAPDDHPLRRSLLAHLVVHATRHVFDHWTSSDSDEDIADLLRNAFRLVLAGVENIRTPPG